MVLFSMQLPVGYFWMAKDVDSGIPDASRNGAHRNRGVSNGGQLPQPPKHAAVQSRQIALWIARVREVQMNRDNVIAIEPRVNAVEVTKGLRKHSSHANQQQGKADLPGQQQAGPPARGPAFRRG